MASTNTLQRTVNYAQQCIRNAPLTGIGGFPNEPAFSIGDWVRQFILSAPFMWRWNRAQTVITTSIGVQDYVMAISNLGFFEKASVTDGTSEFELQMSLDLGADIQTGRPISLAAQLDQNGTITGRLLPVPDKQYTVNISYQIASPNFANLTDTWAPIPDFYYYLVQTGFLAKTFEYANDERFAATMQLFVKQVVAASAGMADTQNNIYLQEFINTMREQQAELGNSQSGRAGRGLFG